MLVAQTFPFAQDAQSIPPQSTSVSVPFFTRSEHDPGEGATHVPALQTVLEQSAPELQSLPVAQRLHVAPPQSTSVSSLSVTRFVQWLAAVTHCPWVQPWPWAQFCCVDVPFGLQRVAT